MTQPDRIKRPIPERTRPKRNVLGALGQSDPLVTGVGPDTHPRHGHPLGPNFDDAMGPGADGTISGADALSLIDEGVRAASDLVDEHIRQGEETARSLGKKSSGLSLAQTDISGLLTGLVRAYSDAAAIWVDLAGSLAQKVEGFSQAGPTHPNPGAAQVNFGLSITCQGPVQASLDMFRPAETLSLQPLISTVEGSVHQIGDVAFDATTTPGRLVINVPRGQAPGTYHGLVLSALDQRPAGALTLQVLPDETAESTG